MLILQLIANPFRFSNEMTQIFRWTCQIFYLRIGKSVATVQSATG